MGDLSLHFSRYEFVCPHCGALILDPELVPALEEYRALAGGRPMNIHDGYRCPEHNAAVGGVPHSEHELGAAADLTITGLKLKQMLAYALSVPAFGGIGIYPDQGFIHVDVRPRLARWARLGGEYVSYEEGLSAMLKNDQDVIHEGGEPA
jgi:hypothetical protein